MDHHREILVTLTGPEGVGVMAGLPNVDPSMASSTEGGSGPRLEREPGAYMRLLNEKHKGDGIG